MKPYSLSALTHTKSLRNANLEAFPLSAALGIVAGLFFSVILCDPIVRFIVRQVRVEPIQPSRAGSTAQWTLVTFVNSRGARWLGSLERALFVVALLQGAREIVAGWLLFKVASKWEAWHNIIRVPESVDDLDTLEFLRYRHTWGVTIMQSFLVGTLANILAGLAGVVVARWTTKLIGG